MCLSLLLFRETETRTTNEQKERNPSDCGIVAGATSEWSFSGLYGSTCFHTSTVPVHHEVTMHTYQLTSKQCLIKKTREKTRFVSFWT